MSTNTRTLILQRCFEAIQTSGFETLRTDKEIIRLKITKGAFYHYFPNKLELGYAVIDEMMLPHYENKWAPIANIQKGIGNAILQILENEKNQATENSVKRGDVLSNLMTEMSHVDALFREKLETVHEMQVKLLQKAILTGRANGELKNNTDARSLSLQIIGQLIGCYSIAKVRGSKDVFTLMINNLQKQIKDTLIQGDSNFTPSAAELEEKVVIEEELNKEYLMAKGTYQEETVEVKTQVATSPASQPIPSPATQPSYSSVDPTSPNYKQPTPFPALNAESTRKEPTPSKSRFNWFGKK